MFFYLSSSLEPLLFLWRVEHFFQTNTIKEKKYSVPKIEHSSPYSGATTNYCKLYVEFQTQYMRSGYYNMVQLT